MKLISLLLALLIAALLVQKQFAQKSTNSQVEVNGEQVTLPKVPGSPKEVKSFEKDINTFMTDAAKQKRKELEQKLSQ